MKGDKLIKAVEQIAKSLAQRYDLDYDLVLAATRQVLQKFKKLNEMKNITTLQWQKRAGILSESQYLKLKTELVEEQALREKVRETLAAMLQEKKKGKKTKPKPEPEMEEPTDMETPDQPMGDEMGMGEPTAPAPTAASSDASLLQATLDFLEVEGPKGDDNFRQMLQNIIAYQAKKINKQD